MLKTHTDKKGKKSLKRELVEWGLIFAVFGVLYFTGLHTPVLGALQSLVLRTGLIRPEIKGEKDFGPADFQFRLMDTSGEILDMESLKGKVVFLNFWATWCPPCIAELPDINRLYQKTRGENVEFLLVSLDDDFEKARRFMHKRGFSVPAYRPVTGIPRAYESRMVPTTFVISPKGRIILKKEGMAEYNTRAFIEFLNKLQ